MQEKEREIIIGGTILLDQISKFLALSFGLASTNQGVLFGTLFNGSIVSLIFVFVILVLLVIFWYLKPNCNLGLSFIIAGGISNLIDRIFRHGVIDFVRLPFFPAFNLADLAIVIGSIFLIIDLLRTNRV